MWYATSFSKKEADSDSHFKFVAASLVSIAIVAGVLAVAAYFLLQGDTAKGSAVLERIEAGLQDVVGDAFDVELQNVNLSFSSDARVVFKSNDVQITRKIDGQNLTNIGQVEAKLNLLEGISGNTAIELIRLEDAEIDADVLGSGREVFLPTHLDKPFNVIGSTLSKFQTYLDKDEFKELEIVNTTIKGTVLGRKQSDPIMVKYLSLNPDGVGRFILVADLQTNFSNISVHSSYALTKDAGSAYKFLATGIHMRECFLILNLIPA